VCEGEGSRGSQTLSYVCVSASERWYVSVSDSTSKTPTAANFYKKRTATTRTRRIKRKKRKSRTKRKTKRRRRTTRGTMSGAMIPLMLLLMPARLLSRYCNTLQHTATRCNTLQHTATNCNTLQHTAMGWTFF